MPTWEEVIAENDDIVSLEETSAHPNFLIFGPSGCGKTVLAGSDDKVMFLTTEAEGCISAKRLGSTARQKIITHWDQLEEFYERLYAWSLTDTGIPFTWVVIDTISEAQNLLFDKILDERNKIVEDWPEYRINQKMLLRYVKKMNALPVNILWLAWDRMETDPDGDTFYCPEIHGKGYAIAMQVCAQMTSYGYLQVKTQKVPLFKMENGERVKDINPRTKKQRVSLESNRFIYWQDIQNIRGKDRTLALAPYTKDLTLKDIRLKVEKAFAEAVNIDGTEGN